MLGSLHLLFKNLGAKCAILAAAAAMPFLRDRKPTKVSIRLEAEQPLTHHPNKGLSEYIKLEIINDEEEYVTVTPPGMCPP